MALFIFDTDVLDRLAAIEGESWRRQQDRDRDSPLGVAVSGG